MGDKLLAVRDLSVHFPLDEGTVRAVDGLSYSLKRGRTLGVVGESGCGKTVTAQSILRILPRPGRIVRGEIIYSPREGPPVDLAKMDPYGEEIRAIRGKEIAYIFQEPMASLSPVHTIGHQMTERIRLHLRLSGEQARAQAIDMLDRVDMPRPGQTIDRYAHQLSGGQRQRAVIAMALVCRPSLLIADEPTTALDVTTESQILDLLLELQRDFGMAMQYITHNLGVVAELVDDVVVMYCGRPVEYGPIDAIFDHPGHPYTQALLRSIPRLGKKSHQRLESIKGMVPDPYRVPTGCAFHPRCPRYQAGTCDAPAYVEVGPNHGVLCNRTMDLMTQPVIPEPIIPEHVILRPQPKDPAYYPARTRDPSQAQDDMHYDR
jgi:oligopeptide/dipeptide ABC transporter ATP-binding protein